MYSVPVKTPSHLCSMAAPESEQMKDFEEIKPDEQLVENDWTEFARFLGSRFCRTMTAETLTVFDELETELEKNSRTGLAVMLEPCNAVGPSNLRAVEMAVNFVDPDKPCGLAKPTDDALAPDAISNGVNGKESSIAASSKAAVVILNSECVASIGD